jgi:hypothetical protein
MSSSGSAAGALRYGSRFIETEMGSALMAGIDCDPSNAEYEFRVVRDSFGKNDGIQVKTVIQSFTEGTDPKLVLEIAKETTEKYLELYGFNHQAAIYVHTNTSHPHAHIYLNSVDYKSGKKFTQHQDAIRFREVSDAVALEHGIEIVGAERKDREASEIEQKRKGISEADGKYSWKKDLKIRIDSALEVSEDMDQFSQFLEDLGVSIKDKNPANKRSMDELLFTFAIEVKGVAVERKSRGSKLDESFKLMKLEERLLDNKLVFTAVREAVSDSLKEVDSQEKFEEALGDRHVRVKKDSPELVFIYRDPVNEKVVEVPAKTLGESFGVKSISTHFPFVHSEVYEKTVDDLTIDEVKELYELRLLKTMADLHSENKPEEINLHSDIEWWKDEFVTFTNPYHREVDSLEVVGKQFEEMPRLDEVYQDISTFKNTWRSIKNKATDVYNYIVRKIKKDIKKDEFKIPSFKKLRILDSSEEIKSTPAEVVELREEIPVVDVEFDGKKLYGELKSDLLKQFGDDFELADLTYYIELDDFELNFALPPENVIKLNPDEKAAVADFLETESKNPDLEILRTLLQEIKEDLTAPEPTLEISKNVEAVIEHKTLETTPEPTVDALRTLEKLIADFEAETVVTPGEDAPLFPDLSPSPADEITLVDIDLSTRKTSRRIQKKSDYEMER